MGVGNKTSLFEALLLMVQKSGLHPLRLVVFPIIFRVSAPSQEVSRISAINSSTSKWWSLVPMLLWDKQQEQYFFQLFFPNNKYNSF